MESQNSWTNSATRLYLEHGNDPPKVGKLKGGHVVGAFGVRRKVVRFDAREVGRARSQMSY